jgi:hypothetical protein
MGWIPIKEEHIPARSEQGIRAVSSAAKSKASASEAAEVVWQTVREESVESLVLSSSLDEVHVFLQALQHTQEHKVWLNSDLLKSSHTFLSFVNFSCFSLSDSNLCCFNVLSLVFLSLFFSAGFL